MTPPLTDPVVHVVIMDVDAETYDRVAQELADEAQRLAAKIPGARGIEVLGTEDKSRIMISSEWDDINSWAHAEWNSEMQAVVLRIFGSATTIQAKIYKHIIARG